MGGGGQQLTVWMEGGGAQPSPAGHSLQRSLHWLGRSSKWGQEGDTAGKYIYELMSGALVRSSVP